MKKGSSLRNQHEIAKKLFEFLYKEGVATCKESYQALGNKCSLTLEEQTCLTRDGKEPQWHNDVRWACMYLKKKGYVVTTKRGIWKITKEGILAF
ncbi:winged helix-turn-helix domain-containing protein [Bacillus pseudomycoides]|uniref:winged helix-turn-helix domain-containing protein n=1 Tax=Bacillus pseudomycoides TaxID=64104 RepID=UPI002E1B9183|nr:winged helix-turn-helix domain-containing protein [Bacillus pseudomycoides]